jgi:hypothetical protein
MAIAHHVIMPYTCTWYLCLLMPLPIPAPSTHAYSIPKVQQVLMPIPAPGTVLLPLPEPGTHSFTFTRYIPVHCLWLQKVLMPILAPSCLYLHQILMPVTALGTIAYTYTRYSCINRSETGRHAYTCTRSFSAFTCTRHSFIYMHHAIMIILYQGSHATSVPSTHEYTRTMQPCLYVEGTHAYTCTRYSFL